MIIYYPTYYLVPVVPVRSLDEDEYNIDNDDAYKVRASGEYGVSYKSERKEVHSTYRNIEEDIFEEIDEEYVNESTQ